MPKDSKPTRGGARPPQQGRGAKRVGRPYQRPTAGQLAERQQSRDAGTQIQLMGLRLGILTQEIKAIFYSLSKPQQDLVLAYEEE